MNALLAALKAAAEPTRLRMLALCAQGEVTVSDLTQILGQSQPRVSRHLKLLCEAGLLERYREGTWAWFRLAGQGGVADLARTLVQSIPTGDATTIRDLARLEQIKRTRAEAASAYFRENAARWHEIRSLHVDEREVEAALLSCLPDKGLNDLLDIGTGTGRMLEVLGPRVRHAIGIDTSREMLAIARANLDHAGLAHCQVRQGDMYQMPFPDASFDAVIIHQVLHFAEEPSDAIAEAARILRPGGRLMIVDFARHEVDELRTHHAHRRLGFEENEVMAWAREKGLSPRPVMRLPGDPLTVLIWAADKAVAEKPQISTPRVLAGTH